MTNLVNFNRYSSAPSTPVTPVADATVRDAGSSLRRPYQVSSATSAMEMAAKTLAAASIGRPTYASIHNAKLSALLKGQRRNDALLSRNVVNHLSRRMIQLRDPRMEDLMRMAPEDDDVDVVMRSLRRKSLQPAAMALIVSSLALNCPPGRRRMRLDRELDRILSDGSDWDFGLLGWLEFGTIDQNYTTQMKALYQRAMTSTGELAKFFDRLRKVPHRRKKIGILIEALGAELSGLENDPPEGAHLAAVIKDLRRLLVFLGFDEACGAIVMHCDTPGLTDDFILHLVIRMIDQFSIYDEWIENQLTEVELTKERKITLLHELIRLFKMFPDTCFRDPDQRKQIVDAIQAAIAAHGTAPPMEDRPNGLQDRERHTEGTHGPAQS
ncbi:TyeA family type III secretion system gatekeeper subunit [Cupriavidus pampae]|uniref:Type III secretion system effector delivery regulator TyeA domain-containing protein n=1 Tax=Cupriavidus pampae TaxID=659251 RepID=A0ABM8XZZ1_9BURK|nr:TyeA family type III secretion system gatekeeper subunit [Cupriavidus pampae]CAG9185916.1 hypothetical protein LMG32289_06159 [Cupriavidus pampae]